MVRFPLFVSVLLCVAVYHGQSYRHKINSENFHKIVKTVSNTPDDEVADWSEKDEESFDRDTFETDESPRDENRLSEGLSSPDGSPGDQEGFPMQDDMPEDLDAEDTPSTAPDQAEDLVTKEDSPDSPEVEGKMITISGFPEHVPGTETLRGALNGVYYQSSCEVQGHPTYWKEKSDDLKDGETPFLYWCGTNSSTKRIHKKWSIINANAYGKVKDGSCITFAPFPAKEEELKEDLHVTSVYKGWHDGVDQGFTTDADEWVKDVKIEKVEKMDRPIVDCQDLL